MDKKQLRCVLEQMLVMRFFAGLSMDPAANTLGHSKRAVESGWTRTRIYWLRERQPDHD